MNPADKQTPPARGAEGDAIAQDKDLPDLTRSSGRLMFPEVMLSMLRGDYKPTPGTSGAVLLQAHPSSDNYTAGRSLAIFAKLAVRREGLWWVLALEAYPDYLSGAEEDYMAAAWKAWIAGSNPFTGGRRAVA